MAEYLNHGRQRRQQYYLYAMRLAAILDLIRVKDFEFYETNVTPRIIQVHELTY